MSDDEYVQLELYESQESDSEEVEERNILKKRRDLWLKTETSLYYLFSPL